MKSHRNQTGKILNQGQEAGPITNHTLETRAREIALIRGATQGFTEADLAEARKELRGEAIPDPAAEDDRIEQSVPTDPSEPRDIPGRQAPVQPAPDEQEAAARLALEGVEEAQHEQMVAARRANRPDRPGSP